jgi:hypothetical protein
MLRSRWAVAVALALALPLGALASGCGATQTTPSEAPPPPPPPKPRNAADIAWDIVHAQVGAMIYVERMRGRPIAEKLGALDLFRPFLEGTGMRPEVDVDRAFIAAPSTHQPGDSIIVAEHRLSNDRIKRAVEFLFETRRLEGSFLDTGGSVPMARVTARGQTKVLALIEPNFVILLPEAHAPEATRFVGTGGFPDPTGKEAFVARAIDPSNTLRGPRLPTIPPTIKSAVTSITLTDNGGADVVATAPSTSAEQATADAAALSQSVEAAMSIKLAFVRIQLFRAIPFNAEGDQVKARVHLTADEIDSLFGALSVVLPR